MKLNDKIANGIAWNTTGLLIENGMQLLVKLMIARFIMPEVFGIIGYAVLFIGMVEAFCDLGMTPALIQRKEKNLSPIDYDTAYWAGIGWSVFLVAILSLLVAPIAASFYSEESLKLIIPVLSFTMIFRNMRAVHVVSFTRELDFKKLVIPRNTAKILASIIAFAMAMNGFGVWSLVFQSVASELFVCIIYSFLGGWRPQRHFSIKSLRKIFSFGIYTTGTNLFGYLTSNIDYLCVGKFLGAEALGLYSLGFNVTYTVRAQIMRVMDTVLYPVYSKLQDNLEATKYYYLKVNRYNCIVIYPLMIGIIFLAKPLVYYGLGPHWLGSVLPMQIMAAAGLIHLLTSSNTVLMRGLGKPKLELIFSLIKTLAINVPLIVLGVIFYGTVGAACGLFAAKVVIFFLNNYILRKVASIRSNEILNNIRSIFLLAAATSLLTFIATDLYVRISIFLIYLALHCILSRSEITQILMLFKDRLSRKAPVAA